MRHKPPSLRNVTLKALVVYIFSIVVFAINLILQKVVIDQKYIESDYKTSEQISHLILVCNILVTYTIPIGSFFYFWIMIKVRNYMPSVSGREKELVSIVPSLLKLLVCLSFSLLGYFVSHYDLFCCCCFDFFCAIDVILFPRCCMFLRLLVTGDVLGGNWNDTKFWDLRLY